jgi:hypothetical protein
MASSWRSRGRKVKDGRFDDVGCGASKFGTNYPSIVVVFISAYTSVLVICFHI